MARTSGGTRWSTSGKLAAIVLCVMLVIAVGYTGFWFYLANQLRERVEILTTSLADDGIVADCGNLAVSGYPFNLGVACDSISAETGYGTGATLSTASFNSSANVLHPGHIVSDLEGPIRLLLRDGRNLEATWQSMQATTDFALAGLQKTGLRSENFQADFSLLQLPTARFGADILDLSARQRGEDLEVAVRSAATTFAGPAVPESLPALDLGLLAALHDSSDFLTVGRFTANELRGRAGRLTNLRAAMPGGAALTLSGPFEISRSGLISGSFDVTVSALPQWVQTLVELFPSQRSTIENANRILSTFAGDGDLSVKLEVREGQASLGIIPIGRIPSI